MTRRPMASEMWPKEPWARSLRQTASIRALDALGERLFTALSLPIGAVVLFLLGPSAWLIYHLQVPGGPVPVSKSSWDYAGPRTDIHLAVQGIFFAVLLWGVLASEPGRHPMREIAYGCVAGSVAILLALTRFRHADRIAQRVSRNESDGLRRLIVMDAVVLRWDPPPP